MSPRRVIRGSTVLPLDGRRLVARSDIVVEDGKIVAIGGVENAGATITELRGIVLPALVQAHAHAEYALTDRHFVPRREPHGLEAQLRAWAAHLDEEGHKVSAEAAISRSLHAGAGAVAIAGPLHAFEASSSAASRYGARLVFALHAAENLRWAFDEAQSRVAASPSNDVKLAIFVGDAERESTRNLIEAARLSAEHKVLVFAHVGRSGRRELPMARLGRTGLLGPRLVLCHGGGARLDKDSIVTLRSQEVRLVLTPGTEILCGRAEDHTAALVEAGICCGVGSDSGATRLGFDLFRELRLLLRVLDGRIDSPASAALEAACRGGASALALDSGRIAVGASADLLVLDLEPGPEGHHEAIARQIIEEGGPERVRMLMVRGRVVAAGSRLSLANPPSGSTEEHIRAAVVSRDGGLLGAHFGRTRWLPGRHA